MRTAAGEGELRTLLHAIGNGLNFIKTNVRGEELDTDVIAVEPQLRAASQEELINFVFPPDTLADPFSRMAIIGLSL